MKRQKKRIATKAPQLTRQKKRLKRGANPRALRRQNKRHYQSRGRSGKFPGWGTTRVQAPQPPMPKIFGRTDGRTDGQMEQFSDGLKIFGRMDNTPYLEKKPLNFQKRKAVTKIHKSIRTCHFVQILQVLQSLNAS